MKLVYTSSTDRNHIKVQYGETVEAIQSELNCIIVNPEDIQGLHLCDCTQNGSFGCKCHRYQH